MTSGALVQDGMDGRGYNMTEYTVHHSLRAFADYISANEQPKKKKK